MLLFPVARTATVGDGESPAERAGEEVERKVMMVSDGDSFVVSKLESKLVQNVQ